MMSGDKTILKRQYESMKAWVDWIDRLNGDDHQWRRVFHYGDWVALDYPLLKEDTCLGGTDEGYIADVSWADSALTVAKTAEVLGYKEDAEKYRAMNKRMEIPTGFDFIKEEDIPQMITWALAETNPFYPVPVIYDRRRCESVIRRIISEA